MQSVAQWGAQQIQGALQPLVSGLLNNSVDILYQTPAADTYQNTTVISLWNVLMSVVTVALASLIVIGGYNVIIAPYFGFRQSSMGAFIPRLLLAFGAA